MKNNITDFEEVRRKGEGFYNNLEEIYCSYFKEVVVFNSDGLEHLYFKQREKRRSEQDQYMRFKLLHLVPEILKLSRTLQGMLETRQFERLRVHNRTETVMQSVRYFEFIAVMKRNRVKIIIKQVGEGRKFFGSIIPFWGMNTQTMARILHEGVPEED